MARVFDGLPVEITPVFFELDGTFPNHEANPSTQPISLTCKPKSVSPARISGCCSTATPTVPRHRRNRRARLALGHRRADRCARELAKSPGAAIVYNVITSRAVPEIVTGHGGVPARTRVGHTFMKSLMAQQDAVIGGEHSGHYYFRDFWRADTGMLAAMHVLAALGDTGKPLSVLVAECSRYVASGEINSEVNDGQTVVSGIEKYYSGANGSPGWPHRATRGRRMVQPAPLPHRTPAPTQRRSA